MLDRNPWVRAIIGVLFIVWVVFFGLALLSAWPI